MKILVINCGSSSLKYQLINSKTEEALAIGVCERIGIDGRLNHTPCGGRKVVIEENMPNHEIAVKIVLDALTDPSYGVIKDLKEINAMGHRVVHGGEHFASSVIIDEGVINKIEECNELAPLHNPANLTGIRACHAIMPDIPNVAVFDTAFHQTMPSKAYMYGLPYEYYAKYKVRRYGFHGTSHSFVSKRTIDILNLPKDNSKIIVCHLGNGASVSAVQNGESVDTSMGLTPLEGLIMGTRSGDIDPAIISYIADKKGKKLKDIMSVLNKKSGVYGLSGGISSDFRDLQTEKRHGSKKAKQAIDVFCYRVAKYIGGYAAAMNGVDAVTFTAGLGENDAKIRKQISSYLGYLGATLDDEKNQVNAVEAVISTDNSPVKILIVPTNEELAIARETAALL
jgi:acetate kinase